MSLPADRGTVLVTGAGGMLARAVRAGFESREYAVVSFEEARLDVTDRRAVEGTLAEVRPRIVIHCAAYTDVDRAEREEERAFAVNAEGARNVAIACRRVGARFVYPSTDYVFDGESEVPYTPEAEPRPLGAYGRSKRAGEEASREAGDFWVVRTSWLYGAGGRNFVSTILERARTGATLRVVDDQRGSPTWTRDWVAAVATLLERGASPGIYHAADRGVTTWYGFACEAVRAAGLTAEVVPVTTEEFPRPAPRPRYSVLDCSATERWVGPLPEWRDRLRRAISEEAL